MTDERLTYIRAHPHWHDHELLEAYDAERAVSDALLAIVLFVKEFFLKLEEGTPENDPLTAIRRKFHKPMHDRLDAAIQLAEARHAG